MDNPLLNKFFQQFEEEAKNTFWDSPIGDFENLKQLKEQVEAHKLFRQTLEGFVIEGKEVEEYISKLSKGDFDNI